MKIKDLIIKLNENGFFLLTKGNHDVYSNGKHLITIPTIHMREVSNILAKKIIKEAINERNPILG